MIELSNDRLNFRFTGAHEDAKFRLEFRRTLRIPDDNREYPLPPGLGLFPLSHVDDFSENLPDVWTKHGGIFLPIYQSEALWLRFSGSYPCAVKIAAGKINAVSGEPWRNELSNAPQDYVVLPEQPWLDGFNVAEGFIRQFVAMPLGHGYTAEEQLTGASEHGGLQIIAYPMKHDIYLEHIQREAQKRKILCYQLYNPDHDMGLAPGGLMRQKIYADKHGIDAWDQENGLRCFVHLMNSSQYLATTGHNPPHRPPTARDYTNSGLPWFEYYSEDQAVAGSNTLGTLTSLAAKAIEKGLGPLTNNDVVNPKVIHTVNPAKKVRDGSF